MSGDPIDRYLRKLRRRWWLRRDRDRRLAEIEDHLRSATTEYEIRGMTTDDAAHRAVDRLGPMDEAFGRERRRALALATVLIIAAASIVAVVQAATGAHSSRRAGQMHPMSSPSRQTRARSDASVTPRMSPSELVRSIESGFSRQEIVAVTFGDPPSEYRHQTTGPWMYVEVPSVNGPDSVLGGWEAHLLAAAYAAQAPTEGLTPETGLFVGTGAACLTDRDPRSCDASGGPINDLPVGASAPVPFNPTLASDSSLRTRIRSGIQRSGMHVKLITMFRVDDHPVPVVVAQTDDPDGVVAHPPTDAALFGHDPNGFEGVYFELDNSAGKPVLVQSFASRIGAGISWSAPGLDQAS